MTVEMPWKSVQSLCRMCVKESRFYKSIHDHFDNVLRLFDVINELCHLDIFFGDGLPEYICTDCHFKLLDFHQFKAVSHEGKSTLLMMKMNMEQMEIKTEVCDDEAPSNDLPYGYSEEVSENFSLSQNENICDVNGGIGYQRQGNECAIISCKEESKDDIDVDDEYDLNHLKSEPTDNTTGEISREVAPSTNQNYSLEIENSNYHRSVGHTYGHETHMPRNQQFVEGVAIRDITQYSMEIEEQESLVCMWCSKTFRSHLSHEKHMKSHNGNESFSCHICGKNFKYYSSLKPHLRIHTSDRRFECSFCHKRFIRKDDLLSHVRNHTGETPFKCNTCGRRFKHNSSFKYHMRHLKCQL